MTNQDRVTRRIDRVNDADGITCCLIVVATTPGGQEMSPKIYYPTHRRYAQLLKEKEGGEELGIDSTPDQG